MKKIFSYLIVIAITYIVSAIINNPTLKEKLIAPFKGKPEETIIKVMYIKPRLVYVKKEPAETSEILGTLKRNTEVGVLQVQDKWVKIKTPAGVSGWVLMASLKEQPPATTKKETTQQQEPAPSKEEALTQYEDLSSNGKIPSSVISVFEETPAATDEPPEIIKQEINKKQTTTPLSKPKKETKPASSTKTETHPQETPQEKTPTTSSEITTPKKIEKQTDVSEEITTCKNCGAEVIKGERFCPICREPIK
ncbi:MAG: SH3 domain-containing protein [Endomicrobiia bacterium]